ncbi:hypothetical protein K449DRAFT_429066 [Hypoxylon sp. EC38]|nr:hypothetical protein K449DRAFT_429066 [Hypoxylon sp. EC38]
MSGQIIQTPIQPSVAPTLLPVDETRDNNNTKNPQNNILRRAGRLKSPSSPSTSDFEARPITQLVHEHRPGIGETSRHLSESETEGLREDKIHPGGDSRFSVLIIAVHLQQASVSTRSEINRPGIFLYKSLGSEPIDQDDNEKTAIDFPRSWLSDILPNIPSAVIEFRLDLRNGQVEFDRAAKHIYDKISDIFKRRTGNTSTIFFTHGYGSVVLQKILRLDDPVNFRASIAAVLTFANPLVSPEAAEIVREWTKVELGKTRKGTTFQKPKKDQPDEIQRLSTENSILVQQYWERPLSNGPFNEGSKRTDLTTIAEVSKGKDRDFRKLCLIAQRAVTDHRMFIAIRCSDGETLKALIDDGYNFKTVTH